MPAPAIPRIDVSPLFGGAAAAQTAADERIWEAATSSGFMVVTGLPDTARLTPERRRSLLRLFTLPPAEIRKLWLWNFDNDHKNTYRGWFPLQNGFPTFKEGIDIGADLVHGQTRFDTEDPLLSGTPFPPEDLLPGWREAARAYYKAMAGFCVIIMQSLARSLGLPSSHFDDAFVDGLSTLRLIRYPVRPPESLIQTGSEDLWTVHNGVRRYLTGRAHADTGFLTVISQDGVGGLQARHHDGTWIDVPPEEGTAAINFGKVLERWTAGRVKATRHRVLGADQERFSIPFFYEPRPDAIISPLPLEGASEFDPFFYGDHLWDTITTHNVEFRGIRHLRPPKGPPPAAN